MPDERQAAFSIRMGWTIEYLGMAALAVSLFLMAFGAGVWAQDSMGSMSAKDAARDSHIAVLQSQMSETSRRVTSIEDRLFGILLTTIGAVVASVTSSVFSIRTHRKVKERGMG